MDLKRLSDPKALFIAWSRLGERFNAAVDGVVFVNGVSNAPINCTLAKRFLAFGYGLEPYEFGKAVVKWIADGKNQKPIFETDTNRVIEKIVEVEKPVVKEVVRHVEIEKVDVKEELPSLKGLKKLPVMLPPEYVKLFGYYTPSGKMKYKFKQEIKKKKLEGEIRANGN